jgi:hypothetical protein
MEMSSRNTECLKGFPEPALFVLNIRTQARPGKTVRTWRLIFARIQSAWNYQKRFIVNGSRGGFSSVFLVDSHPSVQTRSTLQLIYHHSSVRCVRIICCPNDVYPGPSVHLRGESHAGEHAAKENETHGQDMCLVGMEAREDDQGEKPFQAYARSLYWSVIWPSITSRYSDLCKRDPRKQPRTSRQIRAIRAARVGGKCMLLRC